MQDTKHAIVSVEALGWRVHSVDGHERWRWKIGFTVGYGEVRTLDTERAATDRYQRASQSFFRTVENLRREDDSSSVVVPRRTLYPYAARPFTRATRLGLREDSLTDALWTSHFAQLTSRQGDEAIRERCQASALSHLGQIGTPVTCFGCHFLPDAVWRFLSASMLQTADSHRRRFGEKASAWDREQTWGAR